MGFLARSLGVIALALDVAVQALAAPVIQVPQPITVECSGNLSATVNLPAATASDAAGSVAVFGPKGPTAFNLGTTQLNYTAQDAGGTTVATSSVTVADTLAPSIGGVFAQYTVEAGFGGVAAIPLAFEAGITATDVCGPATLKASAQVGALMSMGKNEVSFDAVDYSGNSSVATSIFDVVDTTAPEITAPDSIVVDAGSNGEAFVRIQASAYDAVNGAVAVLGPGGGAWYALGKTEVTLTARDSSGNIAVKHVLVSVLDPNAQTVPEPPSVALALVALACAAMVRPRRH